MQAQESWLQPHSQVQEASFALCSSSTPCPKLGSLQVTRYLQLRLESWSQFKAYSKLEGDGSSPRVRTQSKGCWSGGPVQLQHGVTKAGVSAGQQLLQLYIHCVFSVKNMGPVEVSYGCCMQLPYPKVGFLLAALCVSRDKMHCAQD